MDGELPEFVPLEDPAWVNLPEGVSREAVGRAKAAALRLLKARDRTPVALAQRLKMKGFEEGVVSHVIGRLEAVGLLDERATAERLVRTELRRAAASGRLLVAKLRQNGVSSGVAESVVSEALAEVDLAEAAEAEARKWMGKRGSMDAETARRRLSGRLARRGFSGEIVRGVVDRVVGEME